MINEIFNSITEASNKYNICYSSISECCRYKRKSAGKHPETGEKLKWMYYDEYLNLNIKEDNIIDKQLNDNIYI